MGGRQGHLSGWGSQRASGTFLRRPREGVPSKETGNLATTKRTLLISCLKTWHSNKTPNNHVPETNNHVPETNNQTTCEKLGSNALTWDWNWNKTKQKNQKPLRLDLEKSKQRSQDVCRRRIRREMLILFSASLRSCGKNPSNIRSPQHGRRPQLACVACRNRSRPCGQWLEQGKGRFLWAKVSGRLSSCFRDSSNIRLRFFRNAETRLDSLTLKSTKIRLPQIPNSFPKVCLAITQTRIIIY